jgi:hypothetical protein
LAHSPRQAGASIIEKQKTVACERLFDGHNVSALRLIVPRAHGATSHLRAF